MKKSNATKYTQELEDKIIELNFKVRQLQQQLNTLKESNQEILGKLIHNLKNPVGVIFSFSEMMQNNFLHLPKEKIDKFLDAIHSSAQFSLKFLDRLALYSQLQAISTVKFNTVNFTNLVEKCITEFKNSKPSQNIVTAAANGAPIFINCNAELIEIAVNEIIGNAVKFANENSPINIVLQQIKNEVQLTVNSTGNQIPEKDLPFIFEPFYVVNTYTNSREKCFGLGLPLTKLIATIHNGTTAVANLPNGEVSAVLMLPLNQA